MKPMLAAAACLVLGTTLGCFPYYGTGGQLPISKSPIMFVDASTGAQLDRVLIIPRYSSFTGISSGGGDGPGGGATRCYLADPFVYERGQPFTPRQPKSGGIMVGPAWGFLGRGVGIDGAIVVARGYRSMGLDNFGGLAYLGLTRLPQPEVDREAERILGLLQRSNLVGSDSEIDPFKGCDGKLGIRFTKDQMAVVESFLRGDA